MEQKKTRQWMMARQMTNSKHINICWDAAQHIKKQQVLWTAQWVEKGTNDNIYRHLGPRQFYILVI
jgi:hypothetical protein